ncbi:hypothetical protein [Diaphorobacter aerolatus]|uniref:DUF11 domain-containing protein n=1 Tax=Diaphorobacter aerolatus TaxID=1288495 RepID=A0A7H0GPR3_9BURK|nr:hypothetical protein [Diaphorobacter aerolatus]QNP50279.1 hypothetical protein H9K75_11130 [Diaphorobacter aerolatus]
MPVSGPYAAGGTVTYSVTVKNLSQTAAAPASGAFLSGLAPAGATLVSVVNSATNASVNCANPANCPLPQTSLPTMARVPTRRAIRFNSSRPLAARR